MLEALDINGRGSKRNTKHHTVCEMAKDQKYTIPQCFSGRGSIPALHTL